MISLEKLKILAPLQNLPKNVGDLGKWLLPKAWKICPKSNKLPNLVTLVVVLRDMSGLDLMFFLKNGLFSFIFGLFKQALQFLQQIFVKKCPSSILCQNSNKRLLEHESLPITTRPGLPPDRLNIFTLPINLQIAREIYTKLAVTIIPNYKIFKIWNFVWTSVSRRRCTSGQSIFLF